MLQTLLRNPTRPVELGNPNTSFTVFQASPKLQNDSCTTTANITLTTLSERAVKMNKSPHGIY